MQLTTRPEPHPDFEATASMAATAFGLPAGSFKPARLRWLYERAFSAGTAVLSLYAGDSKVGQVALVRQHVRVGGTAATAVALMDLFIMQAHRSRDAIAGLYGAVEQLCLAEGSRFIVAVPNGKAAGVNAKFLGLEHALTLDIRAGVCAPVPGRLLFSGAAATLGEARALALFARVLPDASCGLAWTPDALWARLGDPSRSFGVHASENLVLISSRRTVRRVPHTLLCAFFARPGVSAAEVRAVTTAACWHQRRPVFIYVGLNAAVPLPGWTLPERLRPSKMIVQQRDFRPAGDAVRFDRFESLDFDFA